MWLIFAALVLSLLFLIVGQVRELFFYWKNDWDFSQDSKVAWGNYYNGEDPTPENMMSNEARVFWGRPFFIAIVAIFVAVSAHIIFHPEQWRRDDNGSGGFHYVGSPEPDVH